MVFPTFLWHFLQLWKCLWNFFLFIFFSNSWENLDKILFLHDALLLWYKFLKVVVSEKIGKFNFEFSGKIHFPFFVGLIFITSTYGQHFRIFGKCRYQTLSIIKQNAFFKRDPEGRVLHIIPFDSVCRGHYFVCVCMCLLVWMCMCASVCMCVCDYGYRTLYNKVMHKNM